MSFLGPQSITHLRQTIRCALLVPFTWFLLACGGSAPDSSPVEPVLPPGPSAPFRALDERVFVYTWRNGALSALSLTFDDGTRDHYEHVQPILDDRGIRATFFVITGSLDQSGWRNGTWAGFLDLAAAGHELGSHTVTHSRLTQLEEGSETEVGSARYELAHAKAEIETRTGKPCLSLAYPFCDRSPELDAMTDSYHLAARSCAMGSSPALWNPASQPSWMSLTSYIPTFPAIRTSPQDDEPSLALTQSVLGTAIPQRAWAILVSHPVVPFEQVATYGGYQPQSTEWLSALCDWILAKVRDGEVWTDTLGNVARYIQERDAARLVSSSADAEEIRFTLVDDLDPGVYDQPLSLGIRIPLDWDRARIIQQDGSTSTSLLDGDSNHILDLQAKPGGGQIRIQRIP